MPLTPLECYQADIGREGFREDPAQAAAVRQLQTLYDSLLTHRAGRSWWDRLRGRRPTPVRGLYLWGGPGRGKTYLVDRFFECLPFAAKRRVHFHAFMQEIHARLQVLPKTPDPLQVIARELAAQLRVLCIDEFHVSDIGDAMLLGGLLEAVFDQGITLVATSNIPVDELYLEGLQRDRFLFAITLLKRHTTPVHLAGDEDHRCRHLDRAGTYHPVTGEAGDRVLSKHLERLAPETAVRDTAVVLGKREVPVVALAADVVWIRFAELCERPLWAADYLELARRFHTLLLADVPALNEDRDDAAKRFMHLIDALYEHNVKLVITAAVPVDALYHGRYLQFAFARTRSRLAEMGAHRYLAKAHRV